MPLKVFRYSKPSSRSILATIVLLMVLGCRQSKPIPAEIVGDSMAPLLCGLHLSQCCPQCGLAFDCRQGQDINLIQCPNCGSQFPVQKTTRPADRVSVSSNQLPNRWDIVAFEHDGNTMIKRVVGLPGEKVAIAGGNVLIDGKLIPKPDWAESQTKQQVFDSAFRPPTKLANLEFDADHWIEQKGLLVHRARDVDDHTFDWINYRHQRNYPHHAPSIPTAWPAIEDDNSFNQNVGRKLNAVNELAVQLDLTLQCGSTFEIHRTIGQKIGQTDRLTNCKLTLSVDESLPQFQGTFTCGKTVESFRGKSRASSHRETRSAKAFPTESPSKETFEISVLLSNIDGRMKVAIDEIVVVSVAQELSHEQVGSNFTEPYLKFGFRSTSNGTVNRCRIWRDIHYFVEAAPPNYELPMTLKQGEYFVLGDNVAVSRDSRHFGPIKKVIGIVQQ